MGISINPEHEEEFPVCKDCGQRHDPCNLAAINLVDVVIAAAKALDKAPIKNTARMICSLMGGFAENLSPEIWEHLLSHKEEPCGNEDCKCHEIINAFLPELYKLKMEADRVKELEDQQ